MMLVDTVSGTGRDVNASAAKYGKKCILEELPDVAAVAKPAENVEVKAHDIFTEQPIKGNQSSTSAFLTRGTDLVTGGARILHAFVAS